MGCLDNLIGIKGCGDLPHLFYINQLTGINISDFDKAISIEKSEAKTALREIIQFSTNLVEAEVNTILAGRYQLKNIINNDIVGYYYDNKVLMPSQAGQLVGYEIRIDQIPYLAFYLQQIRLFAEYTGTVPIKIYDLLQGKLLDTINVDAVAGEIITIDNVDKTYYTNKQRLRLFIGYESTFESYNTSYTSPYGGAAGDNCNTCGGSPYNNSYIYFRAAKTAATGTFTSNDIQGNSVSGGGGLSVGYSLQCSFTEYLCNIRNKIALPILYKAGAMVMKELKHSRRLSGVVTVYAENHDELMKEYELEYEKKMDLVLMNSNLPNSICFHCTPQISSKVVLP